jgi:uracil-DNA glycosylase family 4
MIDKLRDAIAPGRHAGQMAADRLDKRSAYRDLVARCRACTRCHPDLDSVGDALHPSPWVRLFDKSDGELRSLGADLVVVGQDFSARDRENGPSREPDPRIATNKNLRKLLNSAGLGVDRVYLTNAILCLKPGRRLSGPTRAAWFRECRPFHRQTIEIVGPRAVVGLGAKAWEAVQRAFDLKPEPLARAVERGPLHLPDGPLLFAMYHCGGLGLVSRPIERQIRDWARLGARLNSARGVGSTTGDGEACRRRTP